MINFWTVILEDGAKKQFKKLDAPVQKQILNYLKVRAEQTPDPLVFAESLKHELSGLYRFRVENYRIVFFLNDGNKEIIVTDVFHRREVYKIAKRKPH